MLATALRAFANEFGEAPRFALPRFAFNVEQEHAAFSTNGGDRIRARLPFHPPALTMVNDVW
jgi:hypothetical protein